MGQNPTSPPCCWALFVDFLFNDLLNGLNPTYAVKAQPTEPSRNWRGPPLAFLPFFTASPIGLSPAEMKYRVSLYGGSTNLFPPQSERTVETSPSICLVCRPLFSLFTSTGVVGERCFAPPSDLYGQTLAVSFFFFSLQGGFLDFFSFLVGISGGVAKV